MHVGRCNTSSQTTSHSAQNMGSAYFIVLETPINGLDTGMDGKSLSRQMSLLDEAARQLGVQPLSEFYSVDPAQLAEFMESEGIDVSDVEPPSLQQFTAQSGLTTVRALASHFAARDAGIAQDLRDCERILIAAQQHAVNWHFEVDF